jgi:predicted Zn finger-like uncharacterized protein
MPLSICCPNCQTWLRIAPEHAGKTVRCTQCQQPFTATASPPSAPPEGGKPNGAETSSPASDLESDLLRQLRDSTPGPAAGPERGQLFGGPVWSGQAPSWRALLRLAPDSPLTPSILRLTWLCGCALAAAGLFYSVWTFLNVVKELPLKYLFDPIALLAAWIVGVAFLLLNLRLWLELCLNVHRRSSH